MTFFVALRYIKVHHMFSETSGIQNQNFYPREEIMKKQYDMIVIGGGSGGIAAARRASEYGAKCAVIEHHKLGGTCVNVGCVPKKVMWTTSRIAETLHDAADYGFSVKNEGFDWAIIKKSRDSYIARLNDIYAVNLENSDVARIEGTARFTTSSTLQVNGDEFEAAHILIATGSRPVIPNVAGSEYGITSDGFFEMEELPAKVAITGAGYIATEFAGMLHGLGSQGDYDSAKGSVITRIRFFHYLSSHVRNAANRS